MGGYGGHPPADNGACTGRRALDVRLQPYAGVRHWCSAHAMRTSCFWIWNPGLPPSLGSCVWTSCGGTGGGSLTTCCCYAVQVRPSVGALTRPMPSTRSCPTVSPTAMPATTVVPGLVDVTDRAIPGARHGGDLAGMRQHLTTSPAWALPWSGPRRCWRTASHGIPTNGYALTDFYRIDPRFGSNQDYVDFVADARQHGGRAAGCGAQPYRHGPLVDAGSAR